MGAAAVSGTAGAAGLDILTGHLSHSFRLNVSNRKNQTFYHCFNHNYEFVT
jgi:hypothetical protein